MDIKEKISEIMEEIKKNPDLMAEFKKNPVKAVEKVLGVDLPDDLVEKVIAGVKEKMDGKNEKDDKSSLDKLSGAADLLKKIF